MSARKAPSGGDLALLGCPIKLSSGEAPVAPPPALGQHTEEVLRDLCRYDDPRLAHLRSAGII